MNTTNVSRKVNYDGDKQHLQNDLDKCVKGLKNGRYYYILGNVNAYIMDTGIWIVTIKWEKLFQVLL